MTESRMPRSAFLARGATLAAAGSLLAPARALAGDGAGQLGLVGTDHVGVTVPSLTQAVEWFEDVMGAVKAFSFGPFSDTGTFMHELLDVDPAAVIEQISLLRIGHSANIELFQYTAPDQRTTWPRNSDWSGHHIAFYVTDIAEAVEYMQSRGVQQFAGPIPITGGPAAGQTINYFRTPFGLYFELISYPDGMAYERDPSRPLWSPKRNGAGSEVTKVPGLLGIDHIGLTVPNIAQAAAWFKDVLGFIEPLTFGPFEDVGPITDVEAGADILQITQGRGGNGPNVELFQYSASDQDRTLRRNSDHGGHHIAFYVRHIDKAVEYMQRKGVQKLLGPLPITDGPAAGQSINYFKTPFGFVELISYPQGMAYEEEARVPLWDPRDNRP